MAPKLPKCAVCSTAAAGKYRCPVDGVDYCSVKCFKQHKADGCVHTTTAEPSTTSEPSTTEADAASQSEKRSLEEDERPKKKLKDLKWPAEPDSSLWQDPLARDDVKPLRNFEYEAIATSIPIRKLLLESPDLINVLKKLSSLPSGTPNYSQTTSSFKDPPKPSNKEISLRLLLDLPPISKSLVYRPNPGSSKDFKSSFHSGEEAYILRKNETELVKSTPEERHKAKQFVDLIEETLSKAREEHS